MTAFISLSSLTRSIFCVWAILVCVGYIICTVYAFTLKRKIYGISSLACLLLPFFVFHICVEISSYYLFGQINPVALYLGGLPYTAYIITLTVLTGLCLLRLLRSFDYMRTHITPASVKAAADNLPTGFVYFRKNGQPYLTNKKMNELSFELFGHALLDGNVFARELSCRKTAETADGIVYRFTKKYLDIDGETFGEIIAENITDIYRKTEALKANNEKLKLRNIRMKKYGEETDDTVRSEEILKAKINIHDEINKVLLTVDNAIRNNSEVEKQNVIKTLDKNILLLCAEADGDNGYDSLSDLYELARSIGITLNMPRAPKYLDKRSLGCFIQAAEECMINAVKHAGSHNFYIQITEDEANITAVFTNDGMPPARPVNEQGGLRNIRRSAEDIGGTVVINSAPYFTLTIKLPRGIT